MQIFLKNIKFVVTLLRKFVDYNNFSATFKHSLYILYSSGGLGFP